MDDVSLTELHPTSQYDATEATSSQASLTGPTREVEMHDRELLSLPPVDGGRKAWLFLAGSFMIEALIWGFPFSFGIFQEYYSRHLPFSEKPSGIGLIGSSALGIMYLGAPFISMIMTRFPAHRRHLQVFGFILMIVALVSSSFATKVWHLALTQGVMYGISGGLVYFPTVVWLDEWFVKRKGLAFGIMWAGTGVSGIVVPIVMSWGLDRFGFATILRAWAVVLTIMTPPLLYSVKERIPVTSTGEGSTRRRPRQIYFGFVRSPTFLVLQAGNICEGLGFFIPNIYLPTYCHAIGLSSVHGAITVALFNTTSVFGAILVGSASDRMHITSIILISTIGTTLAVFLLWGLAHTLPLLCIFSLVYGLFAGGFSSTYPGITREVIKRDDRAEMGLVFGILVAGRGIGSVLSGPLSELLIAKDSWDGAAFGYGTGYGSLIVFTGVTAFLGGSSWLGRRIGFI